jgi:hypothetical protein
VLADGVHRGKVGQLSAAQAASTWAKSIRYGQRSSAPKTSPALATGITRINISANASNSWQMDSFSLQLLLF